MKCPTCTTIDLVMSERAGIEIDYCPQCRGIWLDRGELDKIIERSVQLDGTRPPIASNPGTIRQDSHHQWGHKEHHGHQRDHHEQRKSFWREIFD